MAAAATAAVGLETRHSSPRYIFFPYFFIYSTYDYLWLELYVRTHLNTHEEGPNDGLLGFFFFFFHLTNVCFLKLDIQFSS
jgi:hypothetical protein